MSNYLSVVKELMMGAGLLTVITIAPEFLVKLRLGFADCDPNCPMSYTCPGVWIYMMGGLLLTALLKYSRCLRFHVAIVLIWLVVCSYKFLMSINSESCVMNQITGYDSPTGPIFVMLIYLVIVFLTVDLLVKWLTSI